MEFTTITPIPRLGSVEALKIEKILPQNNVAETQKTSFADMLRSAMESVTQTNNITKLDAENLAVNAIGDNLHNLEIDAIKAELALSTLLSVRNKALEAYSEIMRITL